MQYNYILLNEGFYRWLETNHLPVQSQILFLKLIHLFNLSGWSEWLTVDNRRMMSLVQTKKEESAVAWRDKLLENGLILYVKGKKGTPNRYKLNDELEFINEAKVTGVKSGVESEVESGVIYKQNKTKISLSLRSRDIARAKKIFLVSVFLNPQIANPSSALTVKSRRNRRAASSATCN